MVPQPPPNKQTGASANKSRRSVGEVDILRGEIERLKGELAIALKEREQSGAFGLELLKEKDELKQKFDDTEEQYKKASKELEELREAWNKAVSQQKESASTVFEKEVQLLNDSDALTASFTHARLEIEKELKQTRSTLETIIAERDRYINEKETLEKKFEFVESERKNLRAELKDLKSRESKLFGENNELEEENVGLQKQISNLRNSIVEFEVSKHEIQRLEDQVSVLESQLEDVTSLKHISERQMQEALEALQSEREQKYALRKELDNKNCTESLINITSMTNDHGHDVDYEIMQEYDMPSIEGSLFSELHLSEMKKMHLAEVKKIQTQLEDKENQRSLLNIKLIETQHKLESATRFAEQLEKKLKLIYSVIKETHKQAAISGDIQQNEVSASSVLDEFETIYTLLKSQQEMTEIISNNKETEAKIQQVEKDMAHMMNLMNVQDDPSDTSSSSQPQSLSVVKQTVPTPTTVNNNSDIQNLKSIIYKKQEQIKILRNIIITNKNCAEVALANLKAKHEMEQAVVKETTAKMRHDMKALREDAATFAASRLQGSARIEEYKTENEKLRNKLAAVMHEKDTLNNLLRMAIERKVQLSQQVEAYEMDRELSQDNYQQQSNSNNKGPNNNSNRRGNFNKNGPRPQRLRK